MKYQNYHVIITDHYGTRVFDCDVNAIDQTEAQNIAAAQLLGETGFKIRSITDPVMCTNCHQISTRSLTTECSQCGYTRCNVGIDNLPSCHIDHFNDQYGSCDITREQHGKNKNASCVSNSPHQCQEKYSRWVRGENYYVVHQCTKPETHNGIFSNQEDDFHVDEQHNFQWR